MIVRFVKRGQEIRGFSQRSGVHFAIVLLFILALSSCFKDEYGALSNFKKNLADADTAFKNNDTTKEKDCYIQALNSASYIDWADGIVIAKLRLANFYSREKKSDVAEETFEEVKQICVNRTDCSSAQLSAVFDNLMMFYLTERKNVFKADQLAREAVSLKHRIENQKSTRNRLQEYAAQMRAAGFPQQAELLAELADKQ